MMIIPVFFWTDILIQFLVLLCLFGLFRSRRSEHWRAAGLTIIQNRLAAISFVALIFFVVIGLLDSMHFKMSANTQVISVLDYLMQPLGEQAEKTYSAPFALHAYVKESFERGGKVLREYPHLQFAAKGIESVRARNQQVLEVMGSSLLKALIFSGVLFVFLSVILRARWKVSLSAAMSRILSGQTEIPWRLLLITLSVIISLIWIAFSLSHLYHIFGTSKVGQDVFFQTIKSIRTGLVIGTLTTLLMLPFAIGFGIAAGYFGGLIDDIIQYIYTTLSSVPGVLLIAASILSLQIFISNHTDWFPSLEQRADARLLALCLILGVTSWTGLCRLLRAETLKIREIEYIQSARALGSSHFRILYKHILPNVMHLVLICVVLDFSALVLAEAVLSYVGVGVDPTAISWGNMINSARLELAREPIVWWPLLAAFIFMFVLVLAANLLADAVRDALDPRH